MLKSPNLNQGCKPGNTELYRDRLLGPHSRTMVIKRDKIKAAHKDSCLKYLQTGLE